MTGIDVASALGRLLVAAGVDQLYGHRFGTLGVVEVSSPVAAVALADAHGRVHGTGAGVHLGHGRFVLGAASVAPEVEMRVDEPADLVDAWHAVTDVLDSDRRASVGLTLDLDPGATLPPGLGVDGLTRTPPGTWVDPPDGAVERIQVAERPMMIVGPGVVADGAVADLHALAAAADLGVLNTWGAKGVFDWRSRHHWATVGLQDLDLDLGGVPESDLVVVCGLDPDELAPSRIDAADVLELAPTALGPLAERVRRPVGPGDVPRLRSRLAEVTQAGWDQLTGPLPPTRVTFDYAQAVAGDRFVAADPGRAGFWVARTFATTRLGGAKVPARRDRQGAAVACAVVARRWRPGWPVLAVADGPMSEDTAEVLAAADELGIPVGLELWDPEGPPLDADAHVARLRQVLAASTTTVVSLAVDPSQLEAMVAAAGPIVAWTAPAEGARP